MNIASSSNRSRGFVIRVRGTKSNYVAGKQNKPIYMTEEETYRGIRPYT
jgi:hypothetical protein